MSIIEAVRGQAKAAKLLSNPVSEMLPDLKASSKTYIPGSKPWRPKKVLLPLNLIVVRFMTKQIP